MEGDGWGEYFMLVAERAPEGVGLESCLRERAGPLRLVIKKKKRALVLQLSGLPGALGSRAKMSLRDEWALTSAFSPQRECSQEYCAMFTQ